MDLDVYVQYTGTQQVFRVHTHTEGLQVPLESVIVFKFLLLLYDVFVLV